LILSGKNCKISWKFALESYFTQILRRVFFLTIKLIAHRVALFVCAAGFFALAGCSSPDSNQTNSRITNTGTAQTKPVATEQPLSTAKENAILTANPNPIQVCDGTGLGVTTLTWSALGHSDLQVRIGSPNGQLFSTSPAASYPTDKWAADGMTAYLQDVTNGKPLTPENTLATVTFKVTSEGCK
jgi:hypothetical protein